VKISLVLIAVSALLCPLRMRRRMRTLSSLRSGIVLGEPTGFAQILLRSDNAIDTDIAFSFVDNAAYVPATTSTTSPTHGSRGGFRLPSLPGAASRSPVARARRTRGRRGAKRGQGLLPSRRARHRGFELPRARRAVEVFVDVSRVCVRPGYEVQPRGVGGVRYFF